MWSGVPYGMESELPAMVKGQFGGLSDRERFSFIEEFTRRRKSTSVAYLLWICLGWHYAYQRKWGLQILFRMTAGGIFMWWLIDLFRVPGMIRDYNKDVAVAAMKDLKAVSA